MSVPPPSNSALPPASVPCPNCGMPWPGDAVVCPNCGYIRPAVPAWPPPPQGIPTGGPLPPPTKLVTGSSTGDILLGLGLSAVMLLAVVGIVAVPVLYFALRRQYPDFGRGLGFGFLVGMALLLGALITCFTLMAQSPQNGN